MSDRKAVLADRFIIVVLAILLVIPWILVMRQQLSRHGSLSRPSHQTARGRVVDAATGQAIPGATILVRSRSPNFGLGDPRLLFDHWRTKTARSAGPSDSTGTYAIRFKELGGSEELSAIAPGYTSIVNGPFPSEDTELRMRRSSNTARKIRYGHFWFVWNESDRIVYFDLDSARVIRDSASAEFALFARAGRRFEIGGVGRGGVIRTGKGHNLGSWEIDCVAPDSSYADRSPLFGFFNQFYFRTEFGARERFGRLAVHSSLEPNGRVGAVGVEFTLNPTGTREVCPEPTLGETQVLAEIESVRTGR